MQRRIEAAPFNGTAIKDRMQIQRVIARPVVMLMRRNSFEIRHYMDLLYPPKRAIYVADDT